MDIKIKQEIQAAQDNLKKIQESFAAEKKKYEESKGYANCPEKSCEDPMYQMCCHVDRCISSVYDYMYRMENRFYEYQYNHSKNHCPPLPTAESVQKFLEAVGLDKSFEVEKPKIYVYASKNRGLEVSASYNKPANEKV